MINFSLKMDNFMMMNEFINMIMAGSGVFAVRYFLHDRLYSFTSNYLG